MKTKAKKEITYKINSARLAEQLSTNNTYNWLVQKGVEQFKSGQIPGKLMITFLEQLNILSIEEN